MNTPKIIILVGIPGAGKTYYAQNYIRTHDNIVHLSSDAIRAELYGDETIQGDANKVFALMQKRAVEALRQGHDVIYDSTAVTRKDRAPIVKACSGIARIECRIIWSPIETCIAQDAARSRIVGKEVIDKMLKRFQSPYYDEGFNGIKVILPDNFNPITYTQQCWDALNIPHDNPHHTLDIQAHCEAAESFARGINCSPEVCIAAKYHDCGKSYTKSYVDSKGNPSEHAHYYSHDNVGSYMSYGLVGCTVFGSWLISNHMQQFYNSKYYNNLKPSLKEPLDQLHQCDLNAH